MEKRRSFAKSVALGAAALASMVGMGSMSSVNAQTLNTPQEVQAPAQKKQRNRKYTQQEMADLFNSQFVPNYVDHGMSPKEYGIRFGNGASRKGRKNFQRMAHTAKVGRRNAA